MHASKLEIDFVIPAYNAERTIGRTLLSLQCQSSPHWKATVVDDGSSDETRTTVERVNDPRIHIVHQPNSGPSTARTLGFGLGTNKLVCFLDADDTLYPDFVVQMANAASTRRIGASCGYDYRTINGHVLHRVGSIDDQRLSRSGMLRLDPPAIMSMVYQRASLEAMMESEPLFDPSMRAYEDWDMLYRLMHRFDWESDAIGRCDQTLASYWCTPGSLSSSLDTVWEQGQALMTSRHIDTETHHQRIRIWGLGVLGACIISNDRTTSDRVLHAIGPLRQEDTIPIAHAMRWQIMRQLGIAMHAQGQLDAHIVERCQNMLMHAPLTHSITKCFAELMPGRVEDLLAEANTLRSKFGRVVIYGLGRNGIEFIDQADRLGIKIVLTDDQPNQMHTDPRRILPCSITPGDVVIVTPIDAGSIACSLKNTEPKQVLIYQLDAEASPLSSLR